ncbi:MAG: hypothetical protein PWP31_1723 [Clostridia bacterium]|nr:hypothetical protein [Clostridia bacterium]
MGGVSSKPAGTRQPEFYKKLLEKIEIVDVAFGRSRLRFRVLPQHLTDRGTLRKSVCIALADRAIGIAVGTTGKKVKLLNLQVGYLRMVEAGQVLECRGLIIYNGERILVSQACLAVPNYQVATAVGIYYVTD